MFYQSEITKGASHLSHEESRHCSLVLRHEVGDIIHVLDGKGGLHSCKLTQVHKRRCEFELVESSFQEHKAFRIHLAIAPTKNIDRMEWLVEKLTEIGVDEITLLETDHSERRKIRIDRLEKKVIGAIKQSGNRFLPKINNLIPFADFIQRTIEGEKYLAHVGDHPYLGDVIHPTSDYLILIGPEGDFSPDELSIASTNGFTPVSIAKHTLRTETAGLQACSFFNFINAY